MKFVFLIAVVLVALLMRTPSVAPSRLFKHSPYSRHSRNHNNNHRHHHTRSLRKNVDDYNVVATNTRASLREIPKQLTTREGKPSTIQVAAGSRLPDCSNACGSCKPCKLVMVSFVCASLSEAESCPMAYKCMCRNKSYPVP